MGWIVRSHLDWRGKQNSENLFLVDVFRNCEADGDVRLGISYGLCEYNKD